VSDFRECLTFYTDWLGNRNADNIDAAFENFDYILYPSRTLYPAHKIRAALLQCFGFGLFTR
jgi:3-oxoacyl-(acyl-carrier-protein) synthase